MQPAVVAQREAGSCRMSGEQAVRAGQVAPVATQRGPTPLQSTTSQAGRVWPDLFPCRGSDRQCDTATALHFDMKRSPQLCTSFYS